MNTDDIDDTLPALEGDYLEEVQIALDRAKITLLTRSVFLSSLSFDLQHRIVRYSEVPTAATDGLSVFYNPEFFMAQDREQQTGLVAHEVWHVAFDHMGRTLDRDPNQWNKAADYVINNMLIAEGYHLPKGALYNPAWKDLSSEEIYDIIKTDDTPDAGPTPGDIKKPGSLTPGYDKGTKADQTAASQKVAGSLSKAQTAQALAKANGKAAGSVPGEVGRHIDKLLNPVIPWNDFMSQFYCDIVKNDFSWQKPNKRYWPDHYLPSQGSPTIGNVVCAIDTSCSVDDKMLAEIYSEVESLRQMFQPKVLTLIGCDSKIQSVHELYPHDDIYGVKVGGGGGTRFQPVLDYCEEHPPSVLLYFTDLEAEHITDEPDYPSLWICYSQHRAQGIGETIYYHPEHST